VNTYVKNMASDRTVFSNTFNFKSGVMETSVKREFKYKTETSVKCILFFCGIKCCGNVRNDIFYFVMGRVVRGDSYRYP